MPSAVLAPPAEWTLADLTGRFGPMPLSRICFDPAPGTATEDDVLAFWERHKRLFELVDGILVEKTVGLRESILALVVAQSLRNFLDRAKRGTVSGSDGMMRLAPNLVRIPDVAYLAWDRFPNRQIPSDPIPSLAPDLAVEVLSPSNTTAEMDRKRKDYFEAGCLLVWFVDPRARTVTVYTSPEQATVLREEETLDGGTVLPGFELSLRKLFAEFDAH